MLCTFFYYCMIMQFCKRACAMGQQHPMALSCRGFALQCFIFTMYTVSAIYHTFVRKRPHYGISAHPPLWLNFLLRSKVYSNMCPYVHVYVAALEHACAIIIKWAWLRSLAVHNHSLRLKHCIRRTRLSSMAIWQVIFQS